MIAYTYTWSSFYFYLNILKLLPIFRRSLSVSLLISISDLHLICFCSRAPIFFCLSILSLNVVCCRWKFLVGCLYMSCQRKVALMMMRARPFNIWCMHTTKQKIANEWIFNVYNNQIQRQKRTDISSQTNVMNCVYIRLNTSQYRSIIRFLYWPFVVQQHNRNKAERLIYMRLSDIYLWLSVQLFLACARHNDTQQRKNNNKLWICSGSVTPLSSLLLTAS